MNETFLQEKNEIIVNALDGQAVTSSRDVSKVFGKRHTDVMKAVKELSEKVAAEGYTQNHAIPPMFIKSTWTNQQNGETYPEYLMNRDGFALLVMGFTGKAALEWKLKYIAAFNEMEKRLATGSPSDPRLAVAEIVLKAPAYKLPYIRDLYPEYFGGLPTPGSLEHTSELNTGYRYWIETLGITSEYIREFPTTEIYETYQQFCFNNHLLAMGKKKFYATVEDDFNLSRRQHANGKRYFNIAQ